MNGSAMLANGLAAIMPSVRATGLLASLARFKMPSGTVGASGAPDGLYVDVPGLVDLITGSPEINCMAAPISPASIVASEIRGLEEIAASEITHVLLDGYYPSVEAGASVGWVVVLSGEIYSYTVMGSESDSQGVMTRLKARLVTV